jgi:hypothetical protein
MVKALPSDLSRALYVSPPDRLQGLHAEIDRSDRLADYKRAITARQMASNVGNTPSPVTATAGKLLTPRRFR